MQVTISLLPAQREPYRKEFGCQYQDINTRNGPKSTLVPPRWGNVDASNPKQAMPAVSFGKMQTLFGGYFHLVEEACPRAFQELCFGSLILERDTMLGTLGGSEVEQLCLAWVMIPGSSPASVSLQGACFSICLCLCLS